MQGQHTINPWGRRSSGSSIWSKFAQGALPSAILVGLVAGYTVLVQSHQAQVLDPKFEEVDFRDGSLSFSQEQLDAEFAAHDRIYRACFGSQPVQFDCYSFGRDVTESGRAVTTSAEATTRILHGPAPVDPSATLFAPTLNKVDELSRLHPNRTFVVIFQSDGEALDWEELKSSATRLAKRTNIAFIAISGVIPTSRSRMRNALAAFKDRFVEFDPVDLNEATITKLAAMTRKAGGCK